MSEKEIPEIQRSLEGAISRLEKQEKTAKAVREYLESIQDRDKPYSDLESALDLMKDHRDHGGRAFLLVNDAYKRYKQVE